MTPSRAMASSNIPEGRTLLLPALSGPAKSRPDVPASPAVVYSLKLTDEMVSQLVSAPDDSSIQFADHSAVLTVPGHHPFKFSTRQLADVDDTSARAVCFSRRGPALRIVGPITAEMDLDREKAVQPSSVAKMRAAEAKSVGKKREMKMADNLPGPPTKKKQRTRRDPEKRPRTNPSRPSRPSIVSSAPKPRPTTRSLRSAPLPPSSGGSPFESPVVSPGRIGPTHHSMSNSRLNGSRRNTPPTSSNTPNGAAAPRRVSPTSNSFTGGMLTKASRPESSDGLRPNLSKVSLRSVTPTKPPSRISPNGSRGPSPRPPSVNSPSSPKTGNLRARSEDIEELRNNVMHFLASNPRSVHEVVSRVLGSDAAHDAKEHVKSVLREVGINKNGTFVLKGHLWPKICEDYPSYSEIERSKMKVARSEYYGANGSSETRSGSPSGAAGLMTETQFDNELKSFNKAHANGRGVSVSNDKDEQELRKTFQKWFPVYAEVIHRLEQMSTTFKNLDKRYRDSRSAADREKLIKQITTQYQKCKVRREELVKILPLLHAKLGSIRDALEEEVSAKA